MENARTLLAFGLLTLDLESGKATDIAKTLGPLSRQERAAVLQEIKDQADHTSAEPYDPLTGRPLDLHLKFPHRATINAKNAKITMKVGQQTKHHRPPQGAASPVTATDHCLLRLRVLLHAMDNSAEAMLSRGYRATDADTQREWVAAKAALKALDALKGLKP